MNERVAIIAALPREVKSLVRGWDTKALPGKVFVYTRGNAVVACAGMGGDRVALAVQAALATGPVSSLVSAGLAGACDPALQVGSIVRAGVVIDTRTGERFEDSQFRQVLVTAGEIASVEEKARLFASYHAAAVDMEAAAVARLARGHGLRFQAIKAISDDAGFELEGLEKFATQDGQFREGAFALHALSRPPLWSKLIQLGGNSKRALAALTDALMDEVLVSRENLEAT